MAIPTIPDQIDNDPIDVKERVIRQFDCPNPDCDESLDITNVNIGTKIKCTACENVTWLPDYGKKWWQKPANIIGGLILSFIIGVLASMTANWINAENIKEPIPIEQQQQEDASNKANAADTKSRAAD